MKTFKTDSSGNNALVEESLVQVIVADTTLTNADSGSTIAVGTDGIVSTLPPTKAGSRYTFTNIGADGNNIITISPQSTDGISGVITLAGSVVARAGTVNVDLVNTKATSKIGSTVTIIGTGVAGVTAWVIKGSTGIWA